MADVSVRPPGPSDAAEIGRIQVETWRTAYAEILPAAVLDALSAEAAAAAWARRGHAPPSPRHHVLVALEQSGGSASSRSARPTTSRPTTPSPRHTVALAPILVEPRWGRRGHGSRLLAAAVDHARARRHDPRRSPGSPRPTRRSREFLVSAGWAPDGLARALDTGAGELREIRLHASLVDDSPRRRAPAAA